MPFKKLFRLLTTWRRLFPFLTWLPQVNRATLRADFMAGLTGAVIVLPQGVAFALIAGLPPEYGLYTAIVTPIVAGLFGSSMHLISGPTTAISIVVFSAVSHHAVPGTPEFISLALTMTFLAGIYQLAFGLARMGALVNFVSHSVVVGFTAGAAVLIATSQMTHILGVDIARGESVLHTWTDIGHAARGLNSYVLVIALVTLATAILVRKLGPKWPHMLIALVAGGLTGVALNAGAHGVALVGELPAHLPPLSKPDFSISTLRQLAPEALAIALLGLIEAVSIARAVATRSQQRINSNQEFIGQGLSNVAGCFLSSYAGSGSFTRSGINYQSGAKTPLSAIFAALLLILMMFFVAPLTAYLPMAAMGGLILLVAWNLVDIHHIRSIIRASRSETIVLAVTFLSTLFLELEFAIYAGVLLSLIFFLRKASRPRVFSMAPDPDEEKRRLTTFEQGPLTECPQLKIVRIDGALFFGSVDHIGRALQVMSDRSPEQNHVLVVANGINVIDVAGAEMLLAESRRYKKLGGDLYLCSLKTGPRRFLERGKYLEELGEDNVFSSKAHAIARIFVRLDGDKCESCEKRIFIECNVGRVIAGSSG